jgi:hypothetical protein
MTKFEQRLPAGENGIMQRLQDLEREVQQMRAARRLEASTIGKGGITIKGGAIILQDALGREIGRMGAREDIPHAPDGSTQPGFILRRNDGSLAFALDDPDPNDGSYRQLLKMQDAQGNIIFSEDTISGWGLATPTLGIPMFPSFNSAVWPSVSGAYGGTWLNYAPMWNPILEVGIQAETTATTGGARLILNGTPYGSALALTLAGGRLSQNWTVDLPSLGGYTPGGVVQIVIECAVLSGTGVTRCCPSWIYGRGSSSIL